jgi:hypothetical protein
MGVGGVDAAIASQFACWRVRRGRDLRRWRNSRFDRMDPREFTVQTTLNAADWQAFVQAYAARMRASISRWRLAAQVALIVAIGLALAALLRLATGVFDVASFVVGVVLIAVTLLLTTRMYRVRGAPDERGAILGRCRFEFTVAGLKVERDWSTGLTQWGGVKDVTLSSTLLLIWIDRFTGYFVPLRDLPAGLTAAEAAARLRSFVADADSASPPTMVAPPPAVPSAAPAAPAASAAQQDGWIAAFGALTVASWLAANRWSAGADPSWFGIGVAGMAWYALAALALSWLVSCSTLPRLPFRSVLLIVVAALPALLILHLAIGRWAPPPLARWSDAGLLAVALLYLAHRLGRLGVRPVLPAVIATTLFALAFSWATSTSYVTAGLWYPSDSEADYDNSETYERGDRLMFEQPSRIDAALGAVAAREPGKPNVFFVGFAGYGEQRVFAEEIALSAKVVAQRYGSGPRTLTLVNDRRNLQQGPFATAVGLERALQGIAAKMDLQQDVLFLVLSSHGSEEASLSVSNGGLPLEQLTGEVLKSALDDAGIRWRIIVISACHSGSFVDALRGDQTIVLTAAASDRTSFGCSDDRDLTYFGEAFFRDALPRAANLRAAFDTAKQAIAVRERKEGVSVSEPQSYFGAVLDRYWAQFEPPVTPAESHAR